MSISNFNIYYKVYKNYLKNINKKNFNYKPLVKNISKKTGGRNNKGFITAYHIGGGVKRLYKKLCFSYILLLNLGLKDWVVERIEYDCNRSCNVALLKNKMNIKKKIFINKFIYFSYFFNIFFIYKLANEGLKRGDFVNFFDQKKQVFAMINQFATLRNIPTGSNIFNIECIPKTKGKLIRSAGSKGKLLRKYDKYGLVAMPSGEKKLFLLNCFASIGEPSNSSYLFKKDYKAGISRLKNRRPTVRGVAMNPIDHPHGGGEGKTSGGRHTVSPWGKLTKGYVTKRKKKKKKKKHV